MSQRKTTRTRKTPKADSPPDEAAASMVPTPGAAPIEAAPPSAPETPRLDHDALRELMDMDPDELAAFMDEAGGGVQHKVGARITGPITRVGYDHLFIDIGGKSEGVLAKSEMPEAVVGQTVTAFVLNVDHQGVQLSTQLSGAAAAEHIEDAQESGIPVEGRVISKNAGGYEVRLGGIRAFCPMSMISRLPASDPDAFVGQTMLFKVLETGDKVVVSRRALEEADAEIAAEKLWLTIEPGQEFDGVVRNVQSFGVFVDIGGLDGLVPRRELGWGDVDPTIYAPGQKLRVEVLEVNRDTHRLTLSARDRANDPWSAVGTEFMAGQVYEAVVASCQTFGAFVELAPGLQGLVHISRLPGGLPKIGATLTVKILEVDHDRRRLSLTPVVSGAAPVETGAEVTGKVSEVLHNGVVVHLDDGRTGWLAAREVVLPGGTVLAQRFRVGKPLTARVVSEDGQRVMLSQKEDPAKSDQAWRAHAKEKPRGSFGTLGDLLGGLKLD
jgi:small subunit ribosomal protein S1